MNEEISLEVKYEEFEAYNDFMGKSSRVTGVCVIANGGVEVVFKQLDPGFNPEMLRLELQFIITAESERRQPVSWHEEWSGDGPQYTEVEFTTNLDVEPPPLMKFKDVH